MRHWFAWVAVAATWPALAGQPPGAVRVLPDSAGAWGGVGFDARSKANNPFFLPLGTNGRSCATCHDPGDAWTSTPAHLRRRFDATHGADPVFANPDGTGCPTMDVATPAAHKRASELLLSKGLIRIELAPPASAEFVVTAVDNPYGCASKSEVSVYRRIPMVANLPYLSTVMWDGRHSRSGSGLKDDLLFQASDAVRIHMAPAVKVPTATLESLVDFAMRQFVAQIDDATAGSLVSDGAAGGPVALREHAGSVGNGAMIARGEELRLLNPKPVFTLYSAWQGDTGSDLRSTARASISRGERIFTTRPITIRGVAGFNDAETHEELPRRIFNSTCRTCHDMPHAGSHSVSRLFDIGTSTSKRRTPDLPLLTLTNRQTGATLQTTDPGLALVSGKWGDVGRFKVPTLRGLAARAPYFHDGSAQTLDDVVDFYNDRFALGLSAQEHADLVAFLKAL